MNQFVNTSPVFSDFLAAVINQADDKQMRRIKDIEKPFHKFINFRILSPAAVIHCDNRD